MEAAISWRQQVIWNWVPLAVSNMIIWNMVVQDLASLRQEARKWSICDQCCTCPKKGLVTPHTYKFVLSFEVGLHAILHPPRIHKLKPACSSRSRAHQAQSFPSLALSLVAPFSRAFSQCILLCRFDRMCKINLACHARLLSWICRVHFYFNLCDKSTRGI